jgi:hypothetical protein
MLGRSRRMIVPIGAANDSLICTGDPITQIVSAESAPPDKAN